MTIDAPKREIPGAIDKEELRRIVAESNARMGIVPIEGATAEGAQQMMLELGIRPEDNAFSRDLIRMRYPDEG